jgi:hypothetical protein
MCPSRFTNPTYKLTQQLYGISLARIHIPAYQCPGNLARTIFPAYVFRALQSASAYLAKQSQSQLLLSMEL